MPDKRCGTCARGFSTCSGAVSCGAPVDTDALFGEGGVNPIWAERKYNPGKGSVVYAVAMAMARAQLGLPTDPPPPFPEGSDCDDMDPRDGENCKMWEAHSDLWGEDEEWFGITHVGSGFEEELSRSGKRRWRPRRIPLPGERELWTFDDRQDEWRPGKPPG